MKVLTMSIKHNDASNNHLLYQQNIEMKFEAHNFDSLVGQLKIFKSFLQAQGYYVDELTAGSRKSGTKKIHVHASSEDCNM